MARKTLFHLRISDESDVAEARQRTRKAALAAGLAAPDADALVTAVSEIARNVFVHAGRGELLLELTSDDERASLVCTAHDQGPGIAHIEAAMTDGYSTGSGLGLGLPSARRLVDELQIQSTPGAGTTVTLTKWLGAPRG